MTPKQTPAPPPPALGLEDIYHIVFRRKWMIVGGILCGLIAAGLTFALWNPTYTSTAEVYIPEIFVTKNPLEQSGDVRVERTSSSTSALSTEVDILRSLDNLKVVAEIITPAKILAKYGIPTNMSAEQSVTTAAQIIQANLFADSPRGTSDMLVSFSSRSPEIVQAVLDQVVTNYIAMSLKIHQPVTDWINRQTDMHSQVLKDAEDQIKTLKDEAGRS